MKQTKHWNIPFCVACVCVVLVGSVYVDSYFKIDWTFTEQNSSKELKPAYKPTLDISQEDTHALSLIEDIITSRTRGKQESGDFRGLGNITCSEVQKFHGVEDLFCKKPPSFQSDYKNPCWKQSDEFVCLPYFQLIGMGKSGTTDLFDRILRHPNILHNDGYLKKETYWWSDRRYGQYLAGSHKIENFDRYIKYFKSAAAQIRRNRKQITGDGTPRDLFSITGWVHIPQNEGLKEPRIITPHLIRHINPDVKLIVLLRNPVERLYSDYYHKKRGEQSPRGFDLAVRNSVSKLHECMRVSSLRACVYNRTLELYFYQTARIHMGFYSIFMKDWLSVFPREQFFIFRTEDYQKNIGIYMQEIYRFLGVYDLTQAEIQAIEQQGHKRITDGKRKAGEMWNSTRFILEQLYRPFNDDLAILLDDAAYLWS